MASVVTSDVILRSLGDEESASQPFSFNQRDRTKQILRCPLRMTPCKIVGAESFSVGSLNRADRLRVCRVENDLPGVLVFFDNAVGLCGVAQWHGSVDDRADLPLTRGVERLLDIRNACSGR